MILSKYQHACFTVEDDEQLLVVDPGGFSTDFIAPEHVVAVVVTHEHGDHYDHVQLEAIIDKNPDAVIIGPESIISQIEVFSTKVAHSGDRIVIGPFALEFFGGEHATIHPSIPVISNVGVLINDLIFYPGDAFTVPGQPIDTLALPVAAPWLKISEVMDYLVEVGPRLAFPTHDAILSQNGIEITDGRLVATANQNGIIYKRLTESITI